MRIADIDTGLPVTFSNSNGVSFGTSGDAITASHAVNVSAGTTSNNLSAITFSNSNGVSFGLNASTVTASVATSLTNINVSAGTTSNNLSAITFSNSNGVSFGLNGSTLTGSVATSLTNINVSAGTTSNNLSAITFSNSNGVSFGLNASTITASHAINVSGGTTSNNLSAITFSNSNGVSFGMNASTMTASITGATLSYFEPPIKGASTQLNYANNGRAWMQPFTVGWNISMYRAQLLLLSSGVQLNTTLTFSGSISGGSASSATGQVGLTGTLVIMSRVSTGTNASSSVLTSYYSNSYSYQINMLQSVSWSTNASSATVSFTTSGQISFNSSFDSAGGVTTGSFGASGSGTFSSTSTNANTFSRSTTAQFASSVLSNPRPIICAFATSLAPGEYWLAHIQSSSGGTTNANISTILDVGPNVIYFTTFTSGYAEIGNTATIATSNLQWGWGHLFTSQNTSTTVALSQISLGGQSQLWFNLMAAVK